MQHITVLTKMNYVRVILNCKFTNCTVYWGFPDSPSLRRPLMPSFSNQTPLRSNFTLQKWDLKPILKTFIYSIVLKFPLSRFQTEKVSGATYAK